MKQDADCVTRMIGTHVHNGQPAFELCKINLPEGLTAGFASRFADMVKWNAECRQINPRDLNEPWRSQFERRQPYSDKDFSRLYAAAWGKSFDPQGEEEVAWEAA